MPQSALHLRGTADVEPKATDGVDRTLTMVQELGVAPDTGTAFSMTLCLCLASQRTDADVGRDRPAAVPA